MVFPPYAVHTSLVVGDLVAQGSAALAGQLQVLDALPIAVIASDTDGAVFYANPAAEQLYGYARDELFGRRVSEVFTPPATRSEGAAILAQVAAGESWAGVFGVLCADGQVKPIRLTNTPLLSADGCVVGVVGCGEDVSALVAATQASRDAEARLNRMALVATELAAAGSVEELVRIIIERGLAEMGADGGSVGVLDEDASLLRMTYSASLGEQLQLSHSELDLDSPLPAAGVVRTGERVLLPTIAAGLAYSPLLTQVYESTGRPAWATMPLRAGGRLVGTLGASWAAERVFSPDELRLLDGFASQCAQSLVRIQHAESQRQAALEAQDLSEALQRSLLTQPPQPDHLQIAVRYLPAVNTLQVGGDLHDGFMSADGAMTLVIGDVNGHDRAATVGMAALRGVLRGLAYDSDDSPAVLLSRLDGALRGLQIDVLATTVLGRVELSSTGGRSVRRLRWSNAGHPPPLLRTPGGRVRVLAGTPDLMLGVDPGTERSERIVDLPDDAVLVLYTDGLVERRGANLDDGISWLARVVEDHGDEDPESLCDRILAELSGTPLEDDVALLVLRAGPARKG